MRSQTLLTTIPAMVACGILGHPVHVATAQTTDLNGTWTLSANIFVSSPPQLNCSFLASIGDSEIPIVQTGSQLSASDTDAAGQQFFLEGTLSGNFVAFTITGFGITPGAGGCSFGSRNHSTTYSGEVDDDAQLLTGTLSGSAEYAFEIDGNGDPVFTAITWTGTFVAARLRQPIQYFALGDSVASGYGLMDDGTRCARSPNGYPHLVLRHLDRLFDVVNRDSFLLACSGHGTAALGSQRGQMLGQLTEGPAIASITAGMDDLDWVRDPLRFGGELCRFSEARFRRWVDMHVRQITANLTRQIEPLVSSQGPQNIDVILTDYYNPTNVVGSIWTFIPACTALELAFPGRVYERTEFLIHSLNAGITQTWINLDRPSRLHLAFVHNVFHGHEAPGAPGITGCGFGPPSVADSWIQYPGDPNSNAPGLEWFHPNAVGAAAIANMVIRSMPTIR